MRWYVLWLAAVLGAAIVGSVLAPSTEASPWPEVKVGRNYCFADHVHYGSSKGQPSKKAALAAAAASFAEGIVFEYGNGYENWSIAASKKINCYQEAGTWVCVVHGLPCRRGK